jgi:hypothetical protein
MHIGSIARLTIRYALLAGFLLAIFSLLLFGLGRLLTPPDVGGTSREQNALANGISG